MNDITSRNVLIFNCELSCPLQSHTVLSNWSLLYPGALDMQFNAVLTFAVGNVYFLLQPYKSNCIRFLSTVDVKCDIA